MPRVTRPGWVPKYRLHKSSGQAYVSLAGREVWLGVHGSDASRSEYDRAVAEWMARGRAAAAPAVPAGPEITVADLILAHWRYAEPLYPRSTLAVLRAALRPVRRLYGRAEVSGFGPLALKAVRAAMVEARHPGTGAARYCRRTVNDYLARIRHVFRWGVSEGLVPPAVLQGLQAVASLRRGRTAARETAPVGPAPEAHIDAALPFLPAMVADMVRVQRLTGARPGELCGMRGADVETGGSVWLYRPARHKTAHLGKQRVVPIGPRAQAVLRPYMAAAAGEHLFGPAASERLRLLALRVGRRTPLTPSQRERDRRHAERPRRAFRAAYTPTAYALAVRRACKRAGVPPWSPNQLRHTRATEIRRDYGLDAAGAVLGHARLETTQIYAERSLELAAGVALRTG